MPRQAITLVTLNKWGLTRAQIVGEDRMTSAGTGASNVYSHTPPFLQNGGACGVLLRGMDWSRHPLGPPDQWPDMLRTTVGIVLGSRQPMLVCWGPENHSIYNDGYAMLCGNRHPAALGLPFSEIWFDIWDILGPLVAQVTIGEPIHMDDLGLVLNRNGHAEEAHFSFSFTPMRNDQNTVVGMFCACEETTVQVMHKRDLEHECTRLGQIFDKANSFLIKLHGPDHIVEMANPAYQRLTGHRDVVGRPLVDSLPEVAVQGYLALLDSVLTTGKPIHIDGAKVTLARKPGGQPEDRFVDFVYLPVRDAKGAITGVIAEGVDVTDHTRALSAQMASEQFLSSIISASPDCIKVLDLNGTISFMSDGGRLIMEVPDAMVIDGTFWPDLWQDPTRSDVVAALELAKTGVAARFQGYGDTMGGNRRYWDVRVTPMLDGSGQPNRLLAVSRDISYLKRIEDEQDLLMNEVSHRLKNAFGMVQSVINQTLRKAPTLQDGHEILSGRIRALAAAQDILTRSIASEMQIDQVVEAALLPHRTGEGRFVIAGPTATINGRQSLGLSLALHELATNAVKYGALTGSSGSVAIGWDIQPGGKFSFHWQESGGPLVSPPKHSGFGSLLIEKIVATYFDGAASLQFPPGGVVFHLSGSIAPSDATEASDPY